MESEDEFDIENVCQLTAIQSTIKNAMEKVRKMNFAKCRVVTVSWRFFLKKKRFERFLQFFYRVFMIYSIIIFIISSH